MSYMINESLKNRDKKNKEKIFRMINEENKYKNRYLQKLSINKNLENCKSLGDKKPLKTKESNNINKYYIKKSQSISNLDNSNKPLGPYSNILNGRGGFCTQIFNIKNNQSQNDFTNNKNNNIYGYYLNEFLSNKKKKIIRNPNLNFFEKDRNKYKTNYLNKRNNNFKNINLNSKVNINAVNRNIIYFKLNNKIKNIDLTKPKDNINKNKTNKKHLYNKEENRNLNKICQNEFFYYNKTPKKNIQDKVILIKQTSEAFSMNHNRTKTFNDLFKADNIMLNYSPSLGNKIYNTNCAICSNQQGFSIIKEAKKKCEIKNEENLIININQISQISQNVKVIQEENYIKQRDSVDKINNKDNKQIIQENEKEKKKREESKVYLEIKNEKKIKESDNKIIINNNIYYDKKDVVCKIGNDIDYLNKNKVENKDYKKDEKNNNIINRFVNEQIKVNENKTKKINDDISNSFRNENDNKEIDNNNKYFMNENSKGLEDLNIEPIKKPLKKREENKNIKNDNSVKNEQNNLTKVNKLNENENQNINNENKKKEESDKKSKQFMRFKARFMKKVGNELKKEGDKFNVSSKIIQMASKLEEKIGKTVPNKLNDEMQQNNGNVKQNDKTNIENKKMNNIIELIEQKPMALNKKKSSKIIFFDE